MPRLNRKKKPLLFLLLPLASNPCNLTDRLTGVSSISVWAHPKKLMLVALKVASTSIAPTETETETETELFHLN
jgi:hypothetical protein